MSKPGVRGEITLKLGDREIVLIPKYGTFWDIQRKTGENPNAIISNIENGSIVTAVQVLSCCGTGLSEDQLFDEIMNNGGVRSIWAELCRFMLTIYTGHSRMYEGAEKSEAPEADATKSG